MPMTISEEILAHATSLESVMGTAPSVTIARCLAHPQAGHHNAACRDGTGIILAVDDSHTLLDRTYEAR